MLFAIAFLINCVAAVSFDEPVMWIAMLPLPPLFVLLGTGCWLFVQPYAAKWRRVSS